MDSGRDITMRNQSPAHGDSCMSDIVDGMKHWIDLAAKYGSENEQLRHKIDVLNLELESRDKRIRELESRIAILESRVPISGSDESGSLRAPATALTPEAMASLQNELMHALRGDEASRPDRRRREPDWDYFKKLISSNNAMSELNNRKAICCLLLLHKENIIDEAFHLKKKYSGNVACHLAKRLRNGVSTETKWSIYEKLFGRKNLRTYVKRTMTVRDRHICKHLDDIMSLAESMN